jgi:hypothetical protein
MAASLWLCSLVTIAAAGCGPAIIGGAIGVVALSGGGGGGGGSSALTIQVGILDESDVKARGITTGVAVMLDMEPGSALVGPLFELTKE